MERPKSRSFSLDAAIDGLKLSGPTSGLRWLRLAALLTVVAGVAITCFFVSNWNHSQEARLQARFDVEVARVTNDIERRFNTPVYGLRGAVGAYMAHEAIDEAAFARYVASRSLATEFPGVRGIGFIERVERSHLAAFEAQRRSEGNQNFRVHATGDLSDLLVIRYIEPLSMNGPALGLDVGNEPVRRQAAQLAIDTGQATLSGVIHLVQDAKSRVGFLLFVPAYHSGKPLDTVEQRRQALLGLMYAPIVLEELMAPRRELFDEAGLHLDFYERSATGAKPSLLYEVGPENPQPALERRLELAVPGSNLVLGLSSTEHLESMVDRQLAGWMLAAGIALSLLLGTVVWQLAEGRHRALRLAMRLSQDVRRLARIAEHTANSVVMLDGRGRATWVNEGFIRTTGYTPQEVLGKTPADLLGGKENGTNGADMIQRAVDVGDACRFTMQNRKKDGSLYWVDTEVIPMRSAQGVLDGYIEISLDITKEREVQAQLRDMVAVTQRQQQELNLLAHVAKATHDAVVLARSDGSVQWVNASFSAVLGWSTEEATGLMLLDVLTRNTQDPDNDAALAQAIATHKNLQCTRKVVNKNGDELWLELDLQPLKDENGAVTGLLMVSRDVTSAQNATRLLQLALKENERFVTAVSAACIYSVTDVFGKILDVNEEFCRISGYGREELIGQDHRVVNSGHQDPAFWKDFWATITVGNIWRGEICNRSRDGTPYWVDTTVIPFLDEQGLPERFISIRNDISGLKTAKVEMEGQRERLANILQGTSAGTWEWRVGSQDFSVNDRWVEITGYPLAELHPITYTTWVDSVHPQDRAVLDAALQAHCAGITHHVDVEIRIRHHSGAWVWVLDRGQIRKSSNAPGSTWMYGTRQDISDRKAAEAALREREHRARLLSGLSAEWFWECGADLRFTQFTGGSPTTLENLNTLALGKTRWELGGVPLAGSWEEHIQCLRQHEPFKAFEYRRVVDDGEEHCWSISGTPIFDETGAFQGYIGIGSDITARKQAEHRLRQSEARLDRTAQIAGVGSWRIDLVRKTVEWSPLACEIHGFTTDHVPSLDEALRWYPQRLQQMIRLLVNEGQLSETAWDLEMHIGTADGRVTWVRDVGRVQLQEGQPVAIVGALQDITMRRTQEETIRAKEARLRAIYNVLPLGIAITDPRGAIVDLNPSLRRLLKMEHRDYTGERHWIAEDRLFNLNGEPIGVEHLPWNHALSESTQVQDAVLELRDEHQGSRWFSVDAVPVAYREYGVVVAFTDISLLKAQSDALLAAKSSAEQASLFKSQFLANMSHEIRTPMNAMLGMLALLQQTSLLARQADYVRKAEAAAQSLLALINDILDFSKIEAGKMALDIQPFDLEELLQGVSVISAANITSKDMEVLFDIDPALPRLLMGDALRLKQVLLNLASNAIKFTARGEVVIKVELRSTQADTTANIRFTVSDTGIGIAPENQERIFAGFTQAEASTTRRFGGTGLGLSICRKLIQLMDGELLLDSELGKGSRFSFEVTLPVASSEALPYRQPLRARDPSAPADRVLVVDDNPVALRLLTKAAQSQGWQVDQAKSGSEALVRWREADACGTEYDLVLLDARMSDIDGWQVAESMRRQMKDRGHDQSPTVDTRLFLVGTSNRDMVDHQGQGSQLPVDGIVIKPLTGAMLRSAYEAALAAVAPTSDTAPDTTTARPLTGLRILVVEDNAVNQQVAEELLSAQGASVDLAVNGLLGVEAISTADSSHKPYDLVLMDMQMPIMDGLTATKEVRKLPAGLAVPIVAMTANAMVSDREACLEAGMNDHIGKPFVLRELVSKIQYWTGRGGQTPSLVTAIPVEPDPNGEIDSGSRSPVDLEAALLRLDGNTALHARLTRQFLADLPALMDQALATTGHPENAHRALHSMKGVALTIGADGLAQVCAEQERRMKGGGALDAQTLLEAAQSAVAALRDAMPEPAAAPSTSIRRPPSAAERLDLERLLTLLEDSDISAFDVVELHQATGEPWIWDGLSQALDLMDFGRAAEIAREALDKHGLP